MKKNFKTTKQQFKASISLTFNSHYWIRTFQITATLKGLLLKTIDHLKTLISHLQENTDKG